MKEGAYEIRDTKYKKINSSKLFYYKLNTSYKIYRIILFVFNQEKVVLDDIDRRIHRVLK